MKTYSFYFLALLFLAGCQGGNSDGEVMNAQLIDNGGSGQFRGQLTDYWYQGKAEINTYDLQQVRYGEVHPGQVSLIFVSEDFLTDDQVKNDNYTNPNSTPILKTNQIRRFTTGIYDYSQMTSVFTPTNLAKQSHTLKVTTSVQDWCGQTFTQFNRAGASWDLELRSYFEKEGDVDTKAKADFIEDELMNRIRMGWKELPTGERNVLPASGYLVMMHKPLEAARATLSLGAYAGAKFSGENELKSYKITYPTLDREVEYVFDAAPPYVIRGWMETYPSRGKTLTTVATLSKQVMAPYWAQNSLADGPLRDELGL